MPKVCVCSAVIVIFGLTMAVLPGAPRAWAADTDEIAAIQQASAAYVKALNDGDQAALAAAWTPDGDYVDAAGSRHKVRELIEQEFGRATRPDRRGLKLVVNNIRLISPTSAIEDATTEHRAEPGRPTANSRFTAYWVKQEGRWLLDSLRESIVPLPPHDPRFADLDWSLGEFVGTSNDGTHVVASSVISPEGKFILREILVTRPDGVVQSTSQRIGWDPSISGFRSWSFDADGSFGEGIWTRQGSNWIVNTTGRTATGEQKSARIIYQQIQHDGFLVSSVGSMVGNETLPDMKVKFTRYLSPE